MRDELRLDRLRIVLDHTLQLLFPFGARLRDVDPRFAQLRLGRAFGEPRDETLRRAGYAERDGEYDADLAGRRAVMHELRVRIEDAVLVHCRKHVDVRADRDNKVGLRHDAIGAAEAVAAKRTQRQCMRRRKCVRRILQCGDRNSRGFRELRHRRGCLLADEAAADDEYGAFGGRKQRVNLIELVAVARRYLRIPIRARRDGFRLARLEQHFAGGFDMRGALRLG